MSGIPLISHRMFVAAIAQEHHPVVFDPLPDLDLPGESLSSVEILDPPFRQGAEKPAELAQPLEEEDEF